jgi:spore germination cell wall hydrolase CwlJ-like protein
MSRGGRGDNVGGRFALVVQDTKSLSIGTQARADWRVLFSAALIGSSVGLGLGAIYLAGGMAQAVSEHSRSERIAEVASGFSEAGLQQQAAGMTPGALRLAQDHDTVAAPSASRLTIPAADRFLNSARELNCLTQAVYFEARGETPRGQAAVAQVVMNRVHSPAFPKTVCGVVFQGVATHDCQFSFVCDGSLHRGRETGAWDRARTIAARALSGVVVADVGSATHFHTTGVSPAWGPQMLRVAQVGLHVFYRFNPHAPATPTHPATTERAVFTDIPMQAVASPGGLRLAQAMIEKAADATAAASGVTAPAPAPVVKTAPLKLPEPPAGLSRASEPSAPPVSMVADSAAS